MSEQSCVAFSVETRSHRGMRKTVAIEFDIEDDSGCALVHASGAELFFGSSSAKTRHFGPYDDVDDSLARWPGSFRRPVTLVEHSLSQGDRVAVLGCADWRPDEHGAAYRDGPLRLHIVQPARSRLLILQL